MSTWQTDGRAPGSSWREVGDFGIHVTPETNGFRWTIYQEQGYTVLLEGKALEGSASSVAVGQAAGEAALKALLTAWLKELGE